MDLEAAWGGKGYCGGVERRNSCEPRLDPVGKGTENGSGIRVGILEKGEFLTGGVLEWMGAGVRLWR